MTSLEQEMGMGFSFKRNPFKKIRLKDVSIKKVTKLAVQAAPLVSTAVSFLPAGGIASKIIDGKVGNLINKASNSKVGQFITKAANTKVGQFVVKNGTSLAKTALTDAANRTLNSGGTAAQGSDADFANQATDATLNPAQQETLSKLQSDGTPKKDNTLLYVVGGVAVLGLGYMAMKKNSN